MDAGIYRITNAVTERFYIGSALEIRKRWNEHRCALRAGTHSNRRLQCSWNKHGELAFAFQRLIICKPDDLLFYEQRCIDGFDATVNGYNIAPIAGNTRGRVMNRESVERMAATKRGIKKSPQALAALRATMSRPEVRAKISLSCRRAIRKPKTADHILKISLANTGKSRSKETRSKLAAANLGKKNGPHSPETRAKISMAQKGRPLADSHVEALREAWKRRKERAVVAAA